jgi:hypothetical protein
VRRCSLRSSIVVRAVTLTAGSSFDGAVGSPLWDLMASVSRVIQRPVGDEKDAVAHLGRRATWTSRFHSVLDMIVDGNEMGYIPIIVDSVDLIP